MTIVKHWTTDLETIEYHDYGYYLKYVGCVGQ